MRCARRQLSHRTVGSCFPVCFMCALLGAISERTKTPLLRMIRFCVLGFVMNGMSSKVVTPFYRISSRF